ncbi:MAG: DUF421 domain-containing protein [Thermotaleaceae bacterium]
MSSYVLVLFRVISIMLLLLFSTLLIMGKRPIGELPVFDFLALVVVGAIVGADIAVPEIDHLPTAFAVLVLAMMQRIITAILIKNKKARRMITFEPAVIIHEGKFVYNNLKKSLYTLDDILMLLREKNIFDLNQVGYAILEANGKISILKKAADREVRIKEIGLNKENACLFFPVIIEGELQRENIIRIHKTEKEVLSLMKAKGYSEIEQVFLAMMDKYGHLRISTYSEKTRKL